MNALVVDAVPESVAFGDFDADGRLDLVTGGFRVWLGVADFQFEGPDVFPAAGDHYAGFADLDLDGDVDVYGASKRGWSTLRNDGHGSFVPPAVDYAGD